MKFIIGKKLDMTQIWHEDEVIPVTRIQAGPCSVCQIKSAKTDGYAAAQLAFDEKKAKNMAKPIKGHLKKAGLANARYLREFRLDKNGKNIEINLQPGDIIETNTFEPGDIVKLTGTSKGKGFQGVVKRYGFSGSKKTHGNKDQERMPGSSGATGPAHVFKGTRMPGVMGNERVTVSNLEIVEVDQANNILFVKGAVPGVRNSLVLISGEGELKIKSKQAAAAEVKTEKPTAEENIEQVVEEAHDKVEEKKGEAEPEQTA